MPFPPHLHDSPAVDDAGEVLREWARKPGGATYKLSSALDILDGWRAAHGHPLNVFQTTLRTKARSVDCHALVVQRHNRLPAIYNKLQKYDGQFSLSEMQDIAGCRVVLSSVKKVYDLVGSYQNHERRHKLLYVNDYIAAPKSSGYRGVHLIFSYGSERKPEFSGYRIEMQFRSSSQHAWATAVETVDIFTRQALKSGKGTRHWRRFFALMGSYLAHKEECEGVPRTPTDSAELRDHLRKYAARLNVHDNLEAFASALEVQSDPGMKAHYYLIELDVESKRVDIKGYQSTDMLQALGDYRKTERAAFESGGHHDTVLVSAESLSALKRSYPNYYLDTARFIIELDEATN